MKRASVRTGEVIVPAPDSASLLGDRPKEGACEALMNLIIPIHAELLIPNFRPVNPNSRPVNPNSR